MKKEELVKLSEKLNFNKEAIENGFKEDPKRTETQITEAAKHMGLIK